MTVAAELCEKQHKKAFYVTCDNYVTLTDGTGVVHIAPAFGEDDANVGRNYDLPFVQLVDAKGEMTDETPYAGVFCKKADPMVLNDLDKKGLLFDALNSRQLPSLRRCDTPLIIMRVNPGLSNDSSKEDLIRNNNTINGFRIHRKGRFGRLAGKYPGLGNFA